MADRDDVIRAICVAAVVGIALAALAVPARAQTGAGGASARPPGSVQGTEWKLASVGDKSAVAGTDASLNLTHGKATGSTGVNRMSGTYTIRPPDSLTFGPLATTRRAGPPDAMAQETALLAAIKDTTGYRLAGSTLELLGASGTLATFTAARGRPRTR
jgi:heat shock protein HslJ